MPQSSLTQVARCAAVASMVVATASGGHLFGGGALPSVPALTAFIVPVTAVVAALGRARWTAVRLLGVLGIAQGAFHLAFMHMSPTTSGSEMTGMTGMTGPGMTAPAWAMPVWHVVATAISTLLVLYAERWIWRVFGVVVPRLPEVAGLPVEASVRLQETTTAEQGLPRCLRGMLTRIRRGPPAPRAA